TISTPPSYPPSLHDALPIYLLQTWSAEVATAPNVTQVALNAALQEGVLYKYSVRSRDPNGAWSEWSPSQTFAVNLSPAPTITVEDRKSTRLNSSHVEISYAV